MPPKPRSIRYTDNGTVRTVTDGGKTCQEVPESQAVSVAAQMAALTPSCPGCLRGEIQFRQTTAKGSDASYPAWGVRCSKCGHRMYVVDIEGKRRYFS